VIERDATALVGHTPLVRLDRLFHGMGTTVLAKLEHLNPGGSVKDRVGLALIEAAEKTGELKPGGTIVEATSGNTGIALAWIGALRGYRVILTMPETMSAERQSLLRVYGAELVLTPGAEGMDGALNRAEQIATETPGAFLARQFTNEANPAIHYATTAEEIWEDTEGKIDLFVASVGTGGTITGVGRFLKERNPDIHVIAVEPAESPLLSEGWAGPHGIQGIGANFVPQLLDRMVVDQILTADTAHSIDWARRTAHSEGLFVGISSGAALAAVAQLASIDLLEGKTIVVMLPDSGDRYMSTGLVGKNG